MVATETGYSTNLGGVSEAAHAKYMPRLFCEYFRKGIARAYSYEFIDEFEDKALTNREAHFGLLRRDGTPKPAYTAVKNLIAVLQEKGVPTGFKPDALNYRLQISSVPGWDRTQYVHHLLLQKSTGEFYLVLWHEVSAEDTKATPHRQIEPPPLPATLALLSGHYAAMLYLPNERAQGRPLPVINNILNLQVSDRVLIIKLSIRK